MSAVVALAATTTVIKTASSGPKAAVITTANSAPKAAVIKTANSLPAAAGEVPSGEGW
jgi:hypothetical protein